MISLNDTSRGAPGQPRAPETGQYKENGQIEGIAERLERICSAAAGLRGYCPGMEEAARLERFVVESAPRRRSK
jgi:hypothetical protein